MQTDWRPVRSQRRSQHTDQRTDQGHWPRDTDFAQPRQAHSQPQPNAPGSAALPEHAGPAGRDQRQPHFVPQRMVVLLGLPGSGKTTLAMRLRQMGWIWINQDVMGDRQRCEFECKQALLAGREVVIDRCNFDERQRATWVRIANEGSHRGPVFVMGLHLDLPLGLCIPRAEARAEHITLNGDNVADVIHRFNGMFQRVTRREGFREIYCAVRQQDIDNFVQFVGPALSYPPAFSTSAYNIPGMPHGYYPNHSAQPADLAQMQPSMRPHLQSQSASADHCSIKGSSERQAGQVEPGQKPPRSNIVPFRKVHSPGGANVNINRPGGIAGCFVDDDDDDGQDTRPILLFDLNGTLTSHTFARRSAGRSLMRPGIPHLRRLQEHFRLGIFTSATQRTAREVLPQLEAAAGPGPPLFTNDSLILHRGHTAKAPDRHVKSGGKEWATCKPLHKWFKHMHRVLLMDDDGYKAVPGEEGNMINIHCWEEEEPEDMHLECVVDILLTNYHGLTKDEDVRTKSQEVSTTLKETVAANVAQHALGQKGSDMQSEQDDILTELDLSIKSQQADPSTEKSGPVNWKAVQDDVMLSL